MKIFHLEFAKTGTSLSGGEKCMIEIIKFLNNKEINNVILTTDNGKELYEKLGLIEGKFMRYIIINSEYTEKKYHVFFSYLIRLFLFQKIKKQIINLIDKQEDVLMCHSEFFPNSIPAFILSKNFSKKTMYWFHMQAPDIFKGYSGHFTNRYHFPELRIIHYKLNQILYNFISRKGIIIAINQYYEKLFKRRHHYALKKFGGENLYILKKYSGVEINRKQATNKNYIYDIAFMGRFHTQKGINEIPDILKKLKQKKPDIKLLIIGGGDKKITNSLLKTIKENHLLDNIDYKGPISTDEKFYYLRQAKIFIFPSYYESFGQVVLEAMANGLPVIAYDLPVFCVFEKGMIKIPVLDNQTMANEIMKLLKDDLYYEKIKKEAIDFAASFSWNKTGQEIYDLIIENSN